MNYRPIYHAGNFADVFKHAILSLIARHLRLKDKPFFLLDTHAGIGRYDLSSEEAQRTGEYRDGIGRLVRVDRKARTGRNPLTGESIKIPAKKVVKFRVAKAAKDAIVPPKKAK